MLGSASRFKKTMIFEFSVVRFFVVLFVLTVSVTRQCTSYEVSFHQIHRVFGPHGEKLPTAGLLRSRQVEGVKDTMEGVRDTWRPVREAGPHSRRFVVQVKLRGID